MYKLSMQPSTPGDAFAHLLSAERARLVRLCAYLSGKPDVAEDLAQETLLEAWRHQHKLTERQGYKPWLSAIARNVCLRWLHQQHRNHIEYAWLQDVEHESMSNVQDQIMPNFDVEVEFERHELATLVDRALALLPSDTRSVLVQKYVEQTPHVEIAARLGLSEGGVAMRLQRGKRALRRILTTHFAAELMSYGIDDKIDEAWQTTRIWCPLCGQAQLNGRFTTDRAAGRYQLQCSNCVSERGITTNITCVNFANFAELFGAVKGFKPALSRLMQWTHAYYRRGLAHQKLPCVKCGQLIHLQIEQRADDSLFMDGMPKLRATCEHCGAIASESLMGLSLCLPEIQQFWKTHSRIHTLPLRKLESNGCSMYLTRIESLTSSAKLDVLAKCDTFEVVRIHRISSM